jgi:hypothetical protein
MFASCILHQPWYFFFIFKCFWQLGWRLTGVRSTLPECSLNVPRMFPECSLNVPWMFPECVQIMAEGGPLKFYTGFPTYCLRVGSHALVRHLLLFLFTTSMYMLCTVYNFILCTLSLTTSIWNYIYSRRAIYASAHTLRCLHYLLLFAHYALRSVCYLDYCHIITAVPCYYYYLNVVNNHTSTYISDLLFTSRLARFGAPYFIIIIYKICFIILL